MSPPPADAAVMDDPVAGEFVAAPFGELAHAARPARRWVALGWPLSAQLRADLGAVWRPLVVSRLLVLVVGALTVLLAGVGAAQWAMDPNDLTTSFGHVGNLLIASSVRWDSIYYLQIAQHGYRSLHDVGFFPLYPLLIRIVADGIGSFVLAGVMISVAAMLATLVIVRRLTALEFDDRTADQAVRLLAFGPMALLLSAVYTESLFLALSAGCFYAARRGRWAPAGILGGLAATTRSGGILLLVPLLIMFFWGPRSDMPLWATPGSWRPRYRAGWSLLWLLPIPLGAQAVNLYFIAHGFGSGAPLRAQELLQHHELVLPVIGLWRGLLAAWHQAGLVLTGTPLTNHPSQALFQCAALMVTFAALVGMFRRLPLAYGAYTLVGLFVLHLSAPTVGDPLSGFARYASLRFPLFVFAAVWAIEHRRSRTVLVAFMLLLVLSTIQFANWQVVGTPTL